MPALCTLAAWIADISLFAASVSASLQVNFPLNQQFPPIARVGRPYTFKFASNTFQYDGDQLQYSLVGHPNWLSIDSNNRTIRGIPGAGDAGTVIFTIAAAGDAGAVANMESTLIVSKEDGPEVNGNISQQLSQAGQLSGPESVVLQPSKPFVVEFSSDTFQASGDKLSYHATLVDHTPLPAWISFDASSLRFGGTTPSRAPQSFDILLIATDVPNYAASSITFTLVVSNHHLFFEPLTQTISVRKGQEVQIDGLRGKLFLDNSSVHNKDIKSATANVPKWLLFDDETLRVYGKPPSGLMSQDISIEVHDRFGDTAKHLIHIIFKSDLFTYEVGKLNITAGKHFEHKIPNSILVKDNEVVSAAFGKLETWLSFDPKTLTVKGSIPSDFTPQEIQGSLTAKTSDDTLKDTQTFPIQVLGSGTHDDHLNEAPTDSFYGAPVEGNGTSQSDGLSGKIKAGIIVGSVLAGILASAILLVSICFLCRRRKRKAHGDDHPKTPRSPRKADISRPIMIVGPWEGMNKNEDGDLEKGKDDESLFKRTPEHPPQLNLDFSAAKRPISHEAISYIEERDSKVLNGFNESCWGFNEGAGPSHHPHDSMKIPTEMLRQESRKSDTPLKHKRRATTIYRDQIHRSSGLPVNRRITGIGHGKHPCSPSRSRQAMSFNSISDRSASIVSTVPSAMPQSPTTRHTTQLTTPINKRKSIRLVTNSPHANTKDRRTIDEKRNSYIRKRVSTQSPFFAASSSRLSSSSYKSPPAFIADATATTSASISSDQVNSIVKPNDDIVEEKENKFPELFRVRKPSEASSTTASSRFFVGSLRKPPSERSFIRKYTEVVTPSNRHRVEKQYDRSSNADSNHTGMGRRASARQSLRAFDLKSSLNSLTGEKVWEDVEMSESNYSSEDEDIEKYESRNTIRPGQYSVLPPLNFKKKSARDSEEENQRNSRRESQNNSKKELKRTSQRDPTPYSRALEHGGKENPSSTYSIMPVKTSTYSSKAKGKAKVPTSPVRPKTTIGPLRTGLAHHSHGNSGTTNSSSTRFTSPGRPLSGRESTKERHSGRSLHSRAQSRQSTGSTRLRGRSRTQSSAYPFFDAPSVPALVAETESGSTKTNEEALLSQDTQSSQATYGLHEDPTISSIGLRTSNGRVNSMARRSSHLVRLHSSSRSPSPSQTQPQCHFQSHFSCHSPKPYALTQHNSTAFAATRSTAPTTPTNNSYNPAFDILASSPPIALERTPDSPNLHLQQQVQQQNQRRTSLGVLATNDDSDEEKRIKRRTNIYTLEQKLREGRPRIRQGKAKRPVSVQVDNDSDVDQEGKSKNPNDGTGGARRTLGSLRAVIAGRGSVWGNSDKDSTSIGMGTGRKVSRESKAFL